MDRLVQKLCQKVESSSEKQVPPRHGAELPTDEYLDREELEFVSGFDALMDAAHYSRLSRQEWETAAQEEFTVGLLFPEECTLNSP